MSLDPTPLRKALLLKTGKIFYRASLPFVPAYEDATNEIKRYASEKGDYKPVSYLTKRAIRSLFALAEVVSTFMNRGLLHLRWVIPVQIPPDVLAEIEHIESRRVHRGIDARVQIAFRHFAKLFGSEFEPDFRAPGWQKFKDLARVRNGFTHPSRLKDLIAHQALPLILPALVWYFDEFQKIFAECANKVGIDATAPGSALSRSLPKTNHTLKNALEGMFDRKFDDAVRASGVSSIRLLQFWLDIHSYEYNQVLKELGQASIERSPARKDLLRRDAPLALVASAESTIGFLQFFLESALQRGERVSAAFRASFEVRDVPSQLVAVVNSFSADFGYRKNLNTSEPGFAAFEQTVPLRDRLIHPKDEKEMEVSDEELLQCMNAAVWYFGIYDAVEFDVARIQ